MQMKFHLISAGPSLPEAGLGVSLFAGGRVMFRSIENEKPYVMQILNHMKVGDGVGTAGLSHVKTDWFVVNLSKHPWLAKRNELLFKKGRITVSGTTFISGSVKVNFEVFDNHGDVKHKFESSLKDSMGFQITSTAVTGVIRPKDYDVLPEEIRDDFKRKYENQPSIFAEPPYE